MRCFITTNTGKNFKGSLVKWVGSPQQPTMLTREKQGFKIGDTILVVSQSVTELEVLHKGQFRHLHIIEVEEV